MMFSNSSGLWRRPWVFIISSYAASGFVNGGWLSLPAATCLFCSRRAATTWEAVMLKCESLSGLSQTRMLYSRAPKICMSLTPYTRASLSFICVMA